MSAGLLLGVFLGFCLFLLFVTLVQNQHIERLKEHVHRLESLQYQQEEVEAVVKETQQELTSTTTTTTTS
jgi:hypothetical protein